MKASEVLQLYAEGRQDFRGENLRCLSFEGKDLSGADFSEPIVDTLDLYHSQNVDPRAIAIALIESDTNLSDKDKAKALKQVKTLAEAGKNPKDEDKKNLADDAITMLKGIVTGLPAAATFVESWNKLLPLITGLFGL